MNTALTAPSKILSLKINDSSFEIKFPNNGQFIDIEARKAFLSKNQYNGIVGGSSINSIIAQNLVDAIATFEQLIPDFVRSLNVSSLRDLDLEYSRVIIKAYREQYEPWMNEWLAYISDSIVRKDDNV